MKGRCAASADAENRRGPGLEWGGGGRRQGVRAWLRVHGRVKAFLAEGSCVLNARGGVPVGARTRARV